MMVKSLNMTSQSSRESSYLVFISGSKLSRLERNGCSGGIRRANFDSPYSKTVKLFFRERKHGYSVPLQSIEKLPAILKPNDTDIVMDWVEEEIAHTMFHYLYTGDYQTLYDPSSKGIAKRQKEYRRSVLAYCAGFRYDMTNLSSHAMRYMKTFEDAVDIQGILVLAKEVFSIYGSCLLKSEYPGYLYRKLACTIEANGDSFEISDYLQGSGIQSILDWLIVEIVVLVFSNKISTLRIENKTLKAVNESLCKDKDEPTCPQKPGPTWTQATSKSGISESAVLLPKPVPLLKEDCSEESSSDEESLDGELGFVNVGKNKEIQEKQPSHVEASARVLVRTHNWSLDLAHLRTRILLKSNFHVLSNSYRMVQLKNIY